MTTSAVGGINTSGISVDSNGKLKVSGFSSGIDWQSLIDAQITADSQPVVNLKAKITADNDKVTAFNAFKAKAQAVTDALNALRGGISNSASVFSQKSVTGSTAPSASAPSGYTPPSADNLLVASVSTTAQSATHTLVVHQLATANQISSDAIGSTTTALGGQGLGFTSGTFSINGKDIAVSSSDTLVDLKSRINSAGAGVTATIVSADSSHSYLVLTANTTGADNAITIGGDSTITDGLGLTANSGADIKNTLVTAQNAIIDVDGITGIERSSNQISDVVDGVTFSLLAADENTTITLNIAPDLSAIETAVNTFVTSYNDLRSFVADQRTASDRNNDGTVDPGEVGPLAYDQTMRTAMDKLSTIASSSVDGAADGYASLGQIGVVIQPDYTLAVDTGILDSKLLSSVDDVQKLFTFSATSSDSRAQVLGVSDSTQAGTYYINIGGTDADGNVTSANISTTSGSGAGGAANGSASVSGKTITGTGGDSDGLNVFFGGDANLSSIGEITVTVSRGLADQLFSYFNNLTEAGSGTIDTQVAQLQTQNDDYQSRIDTYNSRLDDERTRLEAKYTNMETALAKLQTLQNTINSYYNSANGNNSNS